MKRIVAMLVTLLLASSIALSGCSSDTNNGSAEKGTALPLSPVDGGTIRVGITQDIDSLDPHLARSAGTREVLFNVFEGLVKPNASGELVPAVASSYDMSEDAKLYTFTLREGVEFHDGTPVTAEDVKYSIDRVADARNGARLVPAFSIIEEVRIVDSSTIEIHLSEASSDLLAYLTIAIIPNGSSDDFEANPVGTGPFRYASRSIGENIILERFEGYWGTPAFLDTVEFRIVSNPDMFVSNLVGGSIDMAMRLTAPQVAALTEEFTIYEGTMNLVQALYLNNARAPFDNELVRQAINYAIDQEQIMTMVGDMKGIRVGTSMLPGFKEYFDPSFNDVYAQDIEKAKSLLAQAGYADGLEFTITVTGADQPHVDAAQVIVEQLRAINVTANIQLVEWSVWLDEVFTQTNYQATIVGVDASFLTPRALLERFVSDASGNFINFNNAEYDQVFTEAISATTAEVRSERFHRLQEILVEQAANVYIQDLANLVAIRNTFSGYQFYPIYAQDMSLIFMVE